MTVSPIHPAFKQARIPVLITYHDGITQTYWMSLKNFMEMREKGMDIKRIPREEHTSVVLPGQPAASWESEFVENFEDFDTAGLQIHEDKYEVELVNEVRVKKNGKPFHTYKLKTDKNQIARGIIKKIIGEKQ
jgi:hypothetical protein